MSENSTAGAIFPAAFRLKRQEDFSLVFERGQVAVDEVLVVHALRAQEAGPRLGLSVSKKVGNSPQRNRWKRLIRESFRLSRCQLPPHLWLVVRPRRGAVPEFKAIQYSLQRLCRQLDRRLIESGQEPISVRSS